MHFFSTLIPFDKAGIEKKGRKKEKYTRDTSGATPCWRITSETF